jgi:hypothetical protein
MTPTQWKRPRTGDKPLRVQFRCGWVSKHTYTARQLVWEDRGWDFDIIAVERA